MKARADIRGRAELLKTFFLLGGHMGPPQLLKYFFIAPPLNLHFLNIIIFIFSCVITEKKSAFLKLILIKSG